MSSIETFLGTPPPELQPPLPQPQTLLGQHLHHLSASSLGMVLRCPRQFYRRYILGEKQRPGESIVIGSFFHETLDWNYKTKIESHTDQPLSEVTQYMGDVAVPKVLEEEGGEDNILWDTDLNTAHKDSERIMSAYYRLVVPRIQPVGTEERFEMFFPGIEVPIIGYVDVRDETRILDTKTGKQATRKVKPSWQLQGRLYAQARNMPVEYHSVSRAKTPNRAGLNRRTGGAGPTACGGANMVRTVKAASEKISALSLRHEQEARASGARLHCKCSRVTSAGAEVPSSRRFGSSELLGTLFLPCVGVLGWAVARPLVICVHSATDWSSSPRRSPSSSPHSLVIGNIADHARLLKAYQTTTNRIT
jgi:RecB family exonuclease